MGEERNQPNQKHKTKLDILNYIRKKKKKEIKDSIIRDIQTPFETTRKKEIIRGKKKLIID